jgi:hypothetical protein
MADADLDHIIRQTAKEQSKRVLAAVRQRKAKLTAQAAAAKSPEAKARFRRLAQITAELGEAAAKRLQISADNAADSYARTLRHEIRALDDEAQAAQAREAAKAAAAKAEKKPAKSAKPAKGKAKAVKPKAGRKAKAG